MRQIPVNTHPLALATRPWPVVVETRAKFFDRTLRQRTNRKANKHIGKKGTNKEILESIV
jgi:hypothetical protein